MRHDMKDVVKERESAVRERWVHEGLECAILSHPLYTAYNGYVRVEDVSTLPEGIFPHLWPLEVHGGITYGPDQAGWIGFDTSHAGDYWPGMAAVGAMDVVWDMTRLRAEVEKLAEQVRALEESS